MRSMSFPRMTARYTTPKQGVHPSRYFHPKMCPSLLLVRAEPIPRAPPDASFETALSAAPADSKPSPVPTPATAGTKTCGGKCEGPSDCNSGRDDSCNCRRPSTEQAKELGLDPLFPNGVCLAVVAAVGATQNLYGRELDRPILDQRREEADSCLCNSTYISSACCQSRDGMIWETHFRFTNRE